MGKYTINLKKNKKQTNKELKDEIESLKSKVDELESLTRPLQPIGFSYAVAYCKKCGKKEGYNGNKPFNMPKKCSHCGGQMTTKKEEEFLKDIDETFNRLKPEIDKIIKKEKSKNHRTELCEHGDDVTCYRCQYP